MSDSAVAAPVGLDDVDLRLIALLKADARATHDSLATELGLSMTTVRRRTQALLRNGTIARFTITLDPALEQWTEALVTLQFGNGVIPRELTRKLEGVPEVVEAMTVIGEGDVLVKLRARDIEGIERALERLRTTTRVDRTSSEIVLSRLIRSD